MMRDSETFRDQETLDVIRTLAGNGESGLLQMRTGATDGAFFFRNGQIVDARVGSLNGFQAINAAASIRDASFSFDPSVAPPASSSITPNERVVLKQFFGIETVAREEFHDLPVASESIADADEEVTLVGSNSTIAEVPTPIPYVPSSRWLYRGGAILATLFVLIAIAAVALRNKIREQSSTAVAAPVVVTSAPPSSVPPPPLARETAAPNNPAPESAPARDLTGKWNVVNTVQKTSYSSFKDLQIGFDLSIRQNGRGFTGSGQKVSENGRSLPAGSRTPIQVRGSVDGDRVEATFFEDGAARKTNGRFVWRINKAGALTGVFVSSAARTSGKSTAQKEL